MTEEPMSPVPVAGRIWESDLDLAFTSFPIGDFDTWVPAGPAGYGQSDHVSLVLDLGLPS